VIAADGAVLFFELSRHQGNFAYPPILVVSDHNAEVAKVTVVTSQIGRNFSGRCERSLLIRKVFADWVTYRVAVLQAEVVACHKGLTLSPG